MKKASDMINRHLPLGEPRSMKVPGYSRTCHEVDYYNKHRATLICIIFLLLLAPAAYAGEPATPLTIFFTNDVHGKTEPCG